MRASKDLTSFFKFKQLWEGNDNHGQTVKEMLHRNLISHTSTKNGTFFTLITGYTLIFTCTSANSLTQAERFTILLNHFMHTYPMLSTSGRTSDLDHGNHPWGTFDLGHGNHPWGKLDFLMLVTVLKTQKQTSNEWCERLSYDIRIYKDSTL